MGAATDTRDDQTNALADTPTADPLTPPSQPKLSISSTPETLILEWQLQNSAQIANIYRYDASLSEETLIADNLTASTTRLSIASQTVSRIWSAEQFRLELCDSTGCVSSERMDLGSFAASSVSTIRPSVFVQGEQFAKTVAMNDTGSIIVASRPVEGAIQVFMRNKTSWIATESVKIESLSSAVIKDVATSSSGDTIAILLADSGASDVQASVRILLRLGESWLDVEQIQLPDIVIDDDSSIILSDDGDQLLVHARNIAQSFHRTAQSWRRYSETAGAFANTFVAFSPSRRFNVLHALERNEQQLWLVSHHRVQNAISQAWQEFHRTPLQGIDVDDDVILKSHADGSSVIVAGWESTQLEQRTPVIWRFMIHQAKAELEDSSTSMLDSLRAVPAYDSQARLRFAASDDLNNLVIGWQAQAGDDAHLATYTFNPASRQWRVALELPIALSTLAKQGFGDDVALSADGQSLLVSTLSGNSTGLDNRAGELLVIR